jgi:hypothetical protein
MKTTLRVFVLALVLVSVDAIAQDKALLYIDSTAVDPVGDILIYRLREAIRVSENMDLALRESDAVLHLNIVTLDPNNRGFQTVYSAVWVRKDPDPEREALRIYLGSSVGICVRENVESVVSQLASQADSYLALIDKEKSKLLNEAGREQSNAPQR